MITESNVCTCPSCEGAACTCGCQSPTNRATAACQCGDACACGPDCACPDCQCAVTRQVESL